MIKIYIRNGKIEDGNGHPIDVSPATVRAAEQGKVTDALRHAVQAALNEEIVIA